MAEHSTVFCSLNVDWLGVSVNCHLLQGEAFLLTVENVLFYSVL